MFTNFIARDWVDGPHITRNINPSDTHDVVGEYAQGDASQTRDAITATQAMKTAYTQA